MGGGGEGERKRTDYERERSHFLLESRRDFVFSAIPDGAASGEQTAVCLSVSSAVWFGELCVEILQTSPYSVECLNFSMTALSAS